MQKNILRSTQFLPAAAKVIRNFGGCGTRSPQATSDSPRHPPKAETEIAQAPLLKIAKSLKNAFLQVQTMLFINKNEVIWIKLR